MFILIVGKTSDKKLLCTFYICFLWFTCVWIFTKNLFSRNNKLKSTTFFCQWLHHDNLGQPELWKNYLIIEEPVQPDLKNSRFLYVGFYFTQYLVSRSKTPWRNVYINFKKTKTQLAEMIWVLGMWNLWRGGGTANVPVIFFVLRKRVWLV